MLCGSDPRAKLVRKVAYEVFDLLGREPLIEVAVALEQAALSDEFFVKRFALRFG
jgi:citrate synthase